MRRIIGVLFTTALLGMVVTPALAQELLINGGFDVIKGSTNPSYVDAPTSERAWLGPYVIMGCPDAPDCSTGWGSRAWLPSPRTQSPVQIWERSTGYATEVLELYQTVRVSATAQVSFSGWVHTSANPTNHCRIELYDNDEPSGSVVSTLLVDQSMTVGAWYQVQFTNVGPFSSGFVTVKATSTTGAGGVVHLDSFSLTSDTPCGTAHTLNASPITPVQTNHDADLVGATITGSNMDQVTDAWLVQVNETDNADPENSPAPGIVRGSITGSTSGSITVTFPIATVEPPLGMYNVVTMQPDCAAQVAHDVIEIVCANPTSFSGMTESELTLPQEAVTFTVTGAALDELNQIGGAVELALGQTRIDGTILSASDTEMQVRFNLAGALPGVYTLKGTRPDACPNPADLLDALTLNPEDVYGPNLLVNGDFELDPLNPTQPLACPIWKYKETETGSGIWVYKCYSQEGTKPVPNWTGFNGADLALNGTAHTPGPGEVVVGNPAPCPWTAPTTWVRDGNARGCVQNSSGTVQFVGARQALTVIPGEEYLVTGWLFGGTTNTGQTEHAVRVMEGAMELGRTGYIGGQDPWQPVSFTFVPTTTSVNVEFGYDVVSGWEIRATHVDALSVQQKLGIICSDPFADYDEDGDVDQEDFAAWQVCYSGEGLLPGCDCMDADEDLSVDQTDFEAFQDCASGPDVPADASCDDALPIAN